MPVYKKPNGSWRIRVIHKGIRRDLVVYGTETDAKVAEHKLAAEMLGGSGIPPQSVAPVATMAPVSVPITFRAFIASERYKAHLAVVMPRKQGKSLTNRASNLKKLNAVFGDKLLTEIGAQDIESYQQLRIQKVAAVTVNSEITALVAVLNYAKDYCGLAVSVPKYKQLKDQSTDTSAVKLWTDSQVKKLLTACREDGADLYRLVLFLALTGCRKEEALRLKWSSLDFAGKTLRVEGSEDGSYRTKSGKFRTLPMGTDLEALLTDTPHWHTDFVFVSGRTNQPWVAFPQNRFDRCALIADCEGGPHTLRHTYASKFLAAIPDLPLLQRLLGHAKFTTTQRYAHLIPGALEAARNAVSF